MAEVINDLRFSHGLRIQKAERPELKNRLIGKPTHKMVRLVHFAKRLYDSNRKGTIDFSDFLDWKCQKYSAAEGGKIRPSFFESIFYRLL